MSCGIQRIPNEIKIYLTQLYTQIPLCVLSKEKHFWQHTSWQSLVNIWPSADCVNLCAAEKSSLCRRYQ